MVKPIDSVVQEEKIQLSADDSITEDDIVSLTSDIDPTPEDQEPYPSYAPEITQKVPTQKDLDEGFSIDIRKPKVRV